MIMNLHLLLIILSTSIVRLCIYNQQQQNLNTRGLAEIIEMLGFRLGQGGQAQAPAEDTGSAQWSLTYATSA